MNERFSGDDMIEGRSGGRRGGGFGAGEGFVDGALHLLANVAQMAFAQDGLVFEITTEQEQGIVLAGGFDLFSGAIVLGADVAGVQAEAVDPSFDQGRTFTAASAL